jgi:hypothetical protein
VPFGPQHRERLGYPPVDGSEPVQPGVAGQADRDQEVWVADTGMSVRHVNAVPRPAGCAAEVISGRGQLPGFRRSNPANAGGPDNTLNRGRRWRDLLTAGAEERFLSEFPFLGSPKEAFPGGAEGCRCGAQNPDYTPEAADSLS